MLALMLALAGGVLLTSASAENAAAATPIEQCGDAIGSDGSPKIDDRADPGCSRVNDPSRVDALPACSDTVDNDGDGKVDYPADPGCTSAADTDESDPPAQQCADGIDNDLDNLKDYPSDPGCSSALDNDETDPPRQQCADGKDNDLDGRTDFPADQGCVSALDNDETDPVLAPPPPAAPQCDDGIDNDLDGNVDYAYDPGCVAPSDNDETDQAAAVRPSTTPKILSPFPVVRLSGRILTNGVRVTLLTVQAPKGSSISIVCTGSKRSCPHATTKRTSVGVRVRVRPFERTLRRGTELRIYVTKAGFVGKYTRFVIRSRRAPVRSDSCARKVGAHVACP